MKQIKLSVLIVAAICLSKISLAQNFENQNPYTIFGRICVLGGEAENDKPGVRGVPDAVFVIENPVADSPVARLEHNTRTGIVTIFDRAGKIVGEKQLTDAERAWLTQDPKAEKYYPFSTYAYCVNNPINIIDPFGMDNYYINSNGKIRIEFNNDKFNRYNYITTNEKGTEIYNFIGQFDKNDKGLIQMGNFSYDNGNGLSFSYNVKPGNESRSFISGDAMASFLGTIATTGFQDVTVIGVSYADGSSPYPSKSHKNGNNMDLRYLRNDASGAELNIGVNPRALDVDRQNQMNDVLYQFGWKSQLSGPFSSAPGASPAMLNRTKQYPNHLDHLHLQGYCPYIYMDGGTLAPVVVNGKR